MAARSMLQQQQSIEDMRRNFQDFMLHYNHTTEECFKRCVVNLHQRDLTSEEARCSDVCTDMSLRGVNRTSVAFAAEQPAVIQRRMEEVEKSVQSAAGSKPSA